MAHKPFSGAKWYLSASDIFEDPSRCKPSEPTHHFDSTGLHSYTDYHPVKQRRATLGSDPLRDSRMRLRRIFRPGKSISFPTSSSWEYLELPPMPQKPRGYGGRAPNFVRNFEEREIPFHAEPKQKPKGKSLSEIEKANNTSISRIRILI